MDAPNPDAEQTKEEKKGLFAPTPAPPPPNGASERLTDVATRLRLNEQRANELRKQLSFIEQNMISNHRSAMNQIKTAQEDIMRVKQRVQNVEDTLLKITKEFRMVARKEDIDVIKRYVELWDPVKFVTLEQVERMINQALNHAQETTPEAEIESEPAEETAPEDQSEEETEEEPEQTDEDFESLVKKHNV